MSAARFSTCRACGRGFTKDGWCAQSDVALRLCRDCLVREDTYHPRHAPGSACVAEYIEP